MKGRPVYMYAYSISEMDKLKGEQYIQCLATGELSKGCEATFYRYLQVTSSSTVYYKLLLIVTIT